MNLEPKSERYLDHAASATPFEEALTAQAAAARATFANPSAAHSPGRQARETLAELKRRFCDLCGFRDGRLVLTSGGTEANNLAMHGVLAQSPPGRLLVAADAHASILNTRRIRPESIDQLPLDAAGRVTLAALAAALRPDTRLVALSHVGNETGVIHEVAALAALCERRNIPCLVDGTQALGHLPVDLADIPCDFYTFSAHKFGGPRGVGGLLLRSRTCTALLDGGAQEWGLRPGTENLPALAGAVAALETSLAALPVESARLRQLGQELAATMRASAADAVINGDPATGLPGFVSVSFPGYNGSRLVADLAMRGFAVATGSACHADEVEPSPALLAMGRTPEAALGTLRISLGRGNDTAALRAFAKALTDVLREQKP